MFSKLEGEKSGKTGQIKQGEVRSTAQHQINYPTPRGV